jgi:serine/threonine-protein kinase
MSKSNPSGLPPGAVGTPRTPDVEGDLTGKTVGDFHILRRLGQGGMGQVYLAEQVSLKRKIAFKVLKPDLAYNPVSLQRFKAEAEAVARATHANIVQVYAIGEQDGLHYMALEYVDGFNLREYLAKKGTPPLGLGLSIMRQGAAALQRAGEMGIIHRDIKPENILLTRRGEVKIADFGLSRCFAADQPTLNLTQTGVAMGTPLYMSPEQVEGKVLDHRSDIYSFGVTCYHMLAGNPPFSGGNAFEVALQHVRNEPAPLAQVRPDLPPELCAIVARMMAKKVEQRPQTARELCKELTRLRDSLAGGRGSGEGGGVKDESALKLASSSLTTAEATARTQLMSRSAGLFSRVASARWLWWTAAAALPLALAGGAALGWRQRPSAPVPVAEAAPEPEPGPPELSPLQKEEQFLKLAVQQYANPANDNQRALGLGHCLELGLFYLDQWRLEDADRFFTELIDNPHQVRDYRSVGRLGHATVLAFKDQAHESVQAFLDVFDERDLPPRLRASINRYPRFVERVSQAVNRDAANYAAAKEPFPEALSELRKARPLSLGRPQTLPRPAKNPDKNPAT